MYSSYDNYSSYSYPNQQEDKTPRFMGLSLLIHGALVATLSVIGIQKALEAQPEGSDVVVVEFEPTQGEQTEYKEVAQLPLAETTKTSPADESSIPIRAVKPAPKAAAKPPKAKPAKVAKTSIPKVMPTVAKVQAAEPVPTVEESETVVPPQEEEMPPIADLSKPLDEGEINEELDQAAEQQPDETPAALAELEETEKQLEREREEALAAAQAQAEAAEAKKQAAAAARAEAARKAGAEAMAAGMRNRRGAIAKTNQAFGVRDGVRQIGDLRQRPGNIRPAYDVEDRRQQRQGLVNFMAYVTRDGSLTQFKMTRSTGHNTLDKKTFDALKKWKFLPGQEGWVEIPFNWSLRGEAQEAPGGLRRSMGQR
ncbi:MAG: TonB family protein [Pseudobdellovibrionaceae bacterium]